MATIYDIAKLCGFAPVTVSRALNGDVSVKPETRDLIQETARTLNYVPNTSAKNLRTMRTYDIGVLLNLNDSMGLKHFLFADILYAFANHVEKLGYSLTLIPNSLINTEHGLINHCRSRRYDGLFIVCGDITSAPVLELIESHFDAVVVDFLFENKNSINAVTSNNYEMMHLLTDYLLDLNHTDIRYITGNDVYVTRERKRGLLDSFEKHGIAFPVEWFIQSEFYNLDMNYRLVKSLLLTAPRPTAIIMPDDYSAIAAYDAINDLGLSVPDDISVVGFDGIEIGRRMSPSLTTVCQDTQSLGHRAAIKLLAQINSEEQADIGVEVINARFMEGGSVKKV